MNLKRRNSNALLPIIMTITIVLVIAVPIANLFMNITLNNNYTGYLERAASANTVETAKQELDKAITYLEVNEMTSGYTSVLYKSPGDDVGYWYKNLKDSYHELDQVDEKTSPLERTNILMKLRETLMEHGKNGDYVSKPNGLSRYPNNLIWGIINLITVVLFLGLLTYVKSN